MKTVRDFAAAKRDRRKIVVSTAYDAWSARLLVEAGVDCILVGDSAMMVVHGEKDTLGATVELMALHTQAVRRGAPELFIVADMPFLSVRKGKAHAATAAGTLLRAGAQAVKVEGVQGHLDVIAHLVESGIPVMGHLGLLPQSVNVLGGYPVQGRDTAGMARLQQAGAELQAAGAFATVLECVPHTLARIITRDLDIPTIGIGAGRDCDGQVLVFHDFLGLNPGFHPRFVRRFADGAALVLAGTKKYTAAVRSGKFPGPKESF